MDFELGEVLLVNKPLRWTSFDVVNKLRYALKKRVGGKIKVGHAGTLDPLATGLLIICTGKMTKKIDEFTGMDKEYTGSFFIGGTTATYDSELEMDATFPTEHIDEKLLRETAATFIGDIEQMPPIYSAIKIDGQAAYVSARNGTEVTMKMRNVTIKEFELTKIEMPLVYFRVVCSKGTYIRSLAFDFGKALNSGAYLASLCRTKIGNFDVTDAKDVDTWVSEIQTPA
jgi:tRNA pseudouridine55 synthase